MLFAIVLFLLSCVQANSQVKFTVYDQSSESAKQAWNVVFNGGEMPSIQNYLNANNTYNQSLGYLMLALTDNDPDSVIAHVVKSVLVSRELIDTFRFELPLNVQERLASKLPNGREQLLDGLLQLFYKAPWQCDGFLVEKAGLCRENNLMPFLAFTYLNRAMLFSDVIGMPERSLNLIDSAISIWEVIGDSMQMANNIKVRGLVFCSMLKFPQAEKEIKRALSLYTRKHEIYGTLSCQLDLVKLYALKGEPDSMKKYDALCRPYFETNDAMRLFALNTNRISAYKMANQYRIREFIQQTHDLIIPGNINPIMQIEFYKTTIKALTFFNEVALLKQYRGEYDALQRLLLQEDYFPALFE